MGNLFLAVGTLIVLFLVVILRDWDCIKGERDLKFILILMIIDIIYIIKLLAF